MTRSISPYERYGQATPPADAALRVHTVAATDTLSYLAEKYLGDWRLWRTLARRNGIADPRQLVVGQRLVIPAAPQERGAYEV